MRHDDAAVTAARRSPYRHGQTEGQVNLNRLTLLTRQTDGWAHFDVLRRRVLSHVA
jgi:transposase